MQIYYTLPPTATGVTNLTLEAIFLDFIALFLDNISQSA